MQTEKSESTLAQLARAREEAKTTAKTGEGGSVEDETELPEGSVKLAAGASSAEEGEGEAAEQEASGEVTPPAAPAGDDEGELIRIGDQTFKTQAEAIRYAEKLENEKLIAESYNVGIRDALKANAPVVAPAPEEDNFEERFYTNPKEALESVRTKAVDEAVRIVRAENAREKLWTDFFNEYPDLSGFRKHCEGVLQENWEVLGKMTDHTKAMKILAQKSRAVFQEYNERMKPRTELPNRGGQAVSPSGGGAKSVTPAKKEEAPLDFISQMKKLRG